MSSSHLRTAEVFVWDAPRQRLHPRNIYSIRIEVYGKSYQTIEWSLGDFRLANFTSNVRAGTQLIVKPTIKFRDFDIQFEAVAKVLHYDAKKNELLARYTSIKEEHKELLKYFSQAMLTGDMVNIDNVLRRVDMPVTKASTELATTAEPDKHNRFKRYLFSSLYLLLGMGLLTLTLLTLYSSFFRLEIDSAVVSSPVTPVQSSEKGYIRKVHVKVGDKVKKGDNLYQLTNTKLDDRLIKAQKNFEEKKQQVVMLKSLIVTKEKKLQSYKTISQEKHKARQAKVTAESTRLKLTLNKLSRIKKLHAGGMISKAILEDAEAGYAVAVNNLKLAESNRAVTQESLNALKNNFFYTGKELTGNIPELKAELVRAIGQEELSKKALTLAEKKLDQLIITAPVSGEVLNILTTAGQFAQDAQPLLTILDTTEQQHIEAYLTQKEVKWIKLGTQAIANIPALSKQLTVKVTRIDRTKGFYQEVDNRFNWRAPEDRSAQVTLEFENSGSSDTPDAPNSLNDIVIGLPVVLNFKKRESFLQKITQFIGVEDVNRFVESIAKTGSATPAESLTPTKTDSIVHNNTNLSIATKTTKECSPALWKYNDPNTSTQNTSTQTMAFSWQASVLKVANAALKIPPRPLTHIVSSGIDDPNNPQLISSRKSLGDADNAALLAIAYYLTTNETFFKHTKDILLAWATHYIPDGHPINETRLEGMLWAYDSIRCRIKVKDNQVILAWLQSLQAAKHQWKFGTSSSQNNLHTHQLKMLLMLDRLLSDSKSLRKDRQALAKHQKVNLLSNGQSFDYQERDALHYHTYNLEAWLEIALLENSQKEAVNSSYNWLIKQLINDNIHGEFIKSKQAIDARRASKGFSYAKKGGDFNTAKAARSIINHSTLNKLALLKQREYKYLPEPLNKQLLFHYARYFLWKG